MITLSQVGRFLLRNPVIVKEVRTRMRGGKTFIVLTIHLLALAGALAAAYLLFRASLTTGVNLDARRLFGKAIFGLMIWMELITISFIAPALTSGAIASERERQTLDLLRMTQLSSRALVLGKYLSGLVFIFLLVLSSLPLQTLSFIIGGVLAQEILVAILVLAVTAIAFCAVGMFFSSLFSRVLLSTVLSYAFAIFVVFGMPMVFLLVLIVLGAGLGVAIDSISLRTQIMLIFIGWLAVSMTPGATIVATEAALLDQQGLLLARLPLSNSGEITLPSPWIFYVVFYLLISIGMLWFSAKRVSRIEM
jgi:ABC-type transport system involved in multi-copper enzyme maturation permease subunit